MNQIITKHLNESYKYFLLLYDINHCQKVYKNNICILSNNKYVYTFINYASYKSENITLNKKSQVSMQMRDNFISISKSTNDIYVKWINGILQVYNTQNLIIKWRDNGELEFFEYHDIANDEKILNICNVMQSSQEDLQRYAEYFSISLNYDLLKDFDYFQNLQRDKDYVIYRDSECKLNLLKSNVNSTKEKLIKEVNSLKSNPFSYKIQI